MTGLLKKIQRPPAGAFRPPPPPAAVEPSPEPVAVQQENVTDDAETALINASWPVNVEQVVYQGKRAWRACDVYVDAPRPTSMQTILTVRVYALNGTRRTLVASGRLGHNSVADLVPSSAWVVAARSVAQRFEVTIHCVPSTDAGPYPEGELGITVAMSNEAVEAPPGLGEFTVVGDQFALSVLGPPQVTPPPQMELVAVRAVNGAAAARYLMAFDVAPFVAIPAFTLPVRVWPLGAAAGSGIVDTTVRYRAVRELRLLASSTPLFLTGVADCTICTTVR